MDTTSELASLTRSPFVSEARPTVFIIDDDISVRESVEALVAAWGFRPEVFASAEEFLRHPRQFSPSCLVLDLGLPQLNGLELQQRLADSRKDMPIIFITGHADIPKTVQAMKHGAMEFLTKPLRWEVLQGAIQSAIERSRAFLADQTELEDLRSRYDSLTSRQREVMAMVSRGLLNKQVAAELDISEITVKAHRARMMRKMRVRSLAKLVELAARLGLSTRGKH